MQEALAARVHLWRVEGGGFLRRAMTGGSGSGRQMS